MQVLIQIKAVFLCVFVLFFILVPVCIIAAPFKLATRLKIVGPVWGFLSKIVLRYGCHAHLKIAEDHRSESFKGTPPKGIYIANHQSFLDIPLMVSQYQAPPIMKKEVLHIPIFGWMAWISGALPVSRSKSSSRKKVFDKAKKRILLENVGLQVYPEGTRSKDSLPKPYKEIKRTLLVFAYNEKIPVIPTSLFGTRGIISEKGIIEPGHDIGIIIHKEIDPKNFDSVDVFAETCWNQVIKGHDEMKARLQSRPQNLSSALAH